MPFYVYILLCTDGTYYTGYTKNVNERFRLHTCGNGARYTRAHKPERLAYVETLSTRARAMKREKAIKKLSHQEKAELVGSAHKAGLSNKKGQS